MSLAGLREKMKRFDKNAEVIFDHEEPVGTTTDMVMPLKRWFGRSNRGAHQGAAASKPPQAGETGRPGGRPSASGGTSSTHNLLP